MEEEGSTRHRQQMSPIIWVHRYYLFFEQLYWTVFPDKQCKNIYPVKAEGCKWGRSIYSADQPRLVVGSQDIPVVFPRIKGAYGVENGTVEVVDVEKDTVIASYPVSFFPVGLTSVL